MRGPFLIAAVALAACSPPSRQAEAPASQPEAPVCNALAPDFAKLVMVQDEAAAALPAAELHGGRISPGTYDLVTAIRIGQARGWSGDRAVVLDVTETEAGVVFNWAGGAPDGVLDTWTANFTDTPDARITYSCGRIGTVAAAFIAQADALNLRIDDGASGSLYMIFERRS